MHFFFHLVGMKTVMMAAQSIALSSTEVMVAGGLESTSNIPYYLPKSRTGYTYGHHKIVDGIIQDGLWDVYNKVRISLNHCQL